MNIELDFLLQSAAHLYSIGIKLENTRNKLRQLVETNIPYDSPEMVLTLKAFHELESEWQSLEESHLSLRTKLQQKIEIGTTD